MIGRSRVAHRDILDIRFKENVFLGHSGGREGFGIVRIAHERWGATFHAWRSNVRNCVLLHVMSGEGRLRIDEDVFSLRHGMVFAFGPNADHEFWCERARPMELLIVGLGGRKCDRFVRHHLGRSSFAVKPDNPNDVELLMQRMLDVAKSGRPFAHEICRELLGALLLTIRSGLVGAPGAPSGPLGVYQRCRSYLDRNAPRLRSAADAARACHVTPEHMCRLFRRYGDVTPQTYLLRLRVNMAAHLLLSSHMSVKEVAANLGFSDQYAFSKTFKRYAGSSPSEYRAGCLRGSTRSVHLQR